MTHVREGGKDISGAEGGKDVEKEDDTEMDGLDGNVDMEVDGDLPATRKDQHEITGTNSPTSRIQQPKSVEQSSPISSDVERSSQSASSSNPSGQLGRENIVSPEQPVPIVEEGKPLSTPASRAESTYSSPRTQASGSNSVHPSLQSITSRTAPGLPFPIVMSSGPASPRMDTTSAGAEHMVGIVSAEEVQMYIGELADDQGVRGELGRPVDGRRRINLAQDTLEEQEDHSGISRNETLRQNGRGRRASSPGRTHRNSLSSIPITSKRIDGSSSLSRSLTEQTKPGSSSRSSFPPTVSQPQRFKRFVGSLFRSKSVSSAADDDGIQVDQDGDAGSPTAFERSPRRTQSMAASAPPLPTPHNGVPHSDNVFSTAENQVKSPSVMSTRSATHPGSITPRIRTRSERSTSPSRHQQTRTDVEMNLDSDVLGGTGHSPKRSKSRPEPGAGKPSNGSAVEWKCRPGSVPMDGVVSGLGC